MLVQILVSFAPHAEEEICVKSCKPRLDGFLNFLISGKSYSTPVLLQWSKQVEVVDSQVRDVRSMK